MWSSAYREFPAAFRAAPGRIRRLLQVRLDFVTFHQQLHFRDMQGHLSARVYFCNWRSCIVVLPGLVNKVLKPTELMPSASLFLVRQNGGELRCRATRPRMAESSVRRGRMPSGSGRAAAISALFSFLNHSNIRSMPPKKTPGTGDRAPSVPIEKPEQRLVAVWQKPNLGFRSAIGKSSFVGMTIRHMRGQALPLRARRLLMKLDFIVYATPIIY